MTPGKVIRNCKDPSYDYRPVSTLRRLTVATDGSGETRGGPGGWGWATEYDRYQWGGDPQTTHQVLELTAVLEMLRAFPPDQPLLIQADSRNVIKTFTEWLPGWREHSMRRSGGKEVANRELIESDRQAADRTGHLLGEGKKPLQTRLERHGRLSGPARQDRGQATRSNLLLWSSLNNRATP